MDKNYNINVYYLDIYNNLSIINFLNIKNYNLRSKILKLFYVNKNTWYTLLTFSSATTRLAISI